MNNPGSKYALSKQTNKAPDGCQTSYRIHCPCFHCLTCARTPAGPRVTSRRLMSGTNLANSLTASDGKSDLRVSMEP